MVKDVHPVTNTMTVNNTHGLQEKQTQRKSKPVNKITTG